ncbi:MAG: sulfatase [Phycisphaerae bacterium]|nr:sulfatase [Phycisphaerae bacterium]
MVLPYGLWKALLALAIPMMLVPSLSLAAAKQKLNFVFFLVDDMGWTDAGCYGSTFYETPSIDRLAAQGVRFTDAYAACPVCSPTRASILSGKYPARLHLTNWLYGDIRKQLIGPPYTRWLPLEEVTLAEALKAAGYATGFVGKWHLGNEPYWPEHQGFDVNVAGWTAGSPGRGGYFPPYNNPRLSDGPKGEYLTDRLTDEALKFLDANKGRPFLLYLSHYAVHTPLLSKPSYAKKYEAKAEKLPPSKGPRFLPEGARQARQVQDHPVYAGMVQSMDESLGRVMAKLEALGIDDHTAVFFMSDNGGLSTSEGHPTSNVPLRAGKGWLYDGGIREPMIIKWPGMAKPGSVCRAPVTSTDFYPTILEMAGLPLRPEQHRDGVSLVPLLKQRGALGRKAVFWHYPHYSPQGGRPSGAVRCGDLKLIEFYEDNRVELYDLGKDIGEKRDLSTSMPAKTAELRRMLHDWRASLDARMPTPNPDWGKERGRQKQPAG